MAAEIFVTPKEMWRFFRGNRARLEKTMVKVAEDTDTETTIFLTDECGYPMFFVYIGSDECEYEEMAVNSSDCEDVVSEIYNIYLSEQISTSTGGTISRSVAEDLIYETEDKLYFSLIDFLDVILGSDYRNSVLDENDIKDILDHIATYLAEEKSLVVDRPMIIYNDDVGEDVFYRYPYEEFVFTR